MIMQPRLLDINEFIKTKNIKAVTSMRRYSGNKIDETGLFSEEIFGRQGSRERRTKFGYINLKANVIHPEAWGIVTRMSSDIPKCLRGQKYSVTESGAFVADEENGKSGPYYFTKILNKLDLKLFIKKDKSKEKYVNFVRKNISRIIIDKMFILPAGIRDIRIAKHSGKTFIESSEINTIYENLIRQVNSIATTADDLPEDIADPIVQSIQRSCLEINDWIRNKIKGKQGIIRGGIFKKRTDYSGRLVVISDPTLKLGYIGLPWQTVLVLFEPFSINYILYKDKTSLSIIQQELQIEKLPDITDIKRLLRKAKDNPTEIMPELRDYLIRTAREIVADKQVVYKRDPVENRDSWLAAYVRVDSEGHVVKLNPFDFDRTGGDCDGDQYVVYSLLTKEAIHEAKTKLNPRHNKGMWTKVTNANSCPYGIQLDAATAIFAATRK
jgi:DNA-directed RNA polymerase beta' subunit